MDDLPWMLKPQVVLIVYVVGLERLVHVVDVG